MAGRGPAPKDPSRRQRRNKPNVILKQLPPVDWSAYNARMRAAEAEDAAAEAAEEETDDDRTDP